MMLQLKHFKSDKATSMIQSNQQLNILNISVMLNQKISIFYSSTINILKC